MDVDIARARSRSYAKLAEAFARPEEGLEADYAYLFVGPGRPVARPYESTHREHRMMGDCTLAVRSLYAEEGLAPEPGLLPDHVAMELEFMAHLARKEGDAREAGDGEGVLACLRQQESFLQEHLGRWVPSFCQEVLVSEAPPFYADLAQRTWDQVAEDLARLRRSLREEAAASGEGADNWTVALERACTLCGLCTQLCRPGALKMTMEDGEVRLLLDATACDGCAACEQRCPERAIAVKRSTGSEGGNVLLSSSPLAVCPRCGKASAPRLLLDRIQELAAIEDKAWRQRVALCPTCRLFQGDAPLPEEDQ